MVSKKDQKNRGNKIRGFGKKIAILLLVGTVLASGILVWGTDIKVNAANVVQIPSTEVDGVYHQSVDTNQLEGWAQGPHIYSEAGIVMDMDSGAILYGKNIDAQHYPASITKVMTALVALEQNMLTDTVTVSQEDISFLEYGDAHIGLRPGEQITMEDALFGMLLASGNEVSHAIGSSTPGGYENFLQLMNEKARELGCTNSNFMNPHGLHDEEHYVSAHDMALIGAAVFQYEDFRRITATLQHTIPETNLVNETRTFQQNHKMLFDWREQYYEYCVGGKTGYTDQALNTLITFAQKDGVNLVAVVLRAHGGNANAYKDTKAMLEYGFHNFSKVSVTPDMVEDTDIASIDTNAYVMLPEGITMHSLEAEVQKPTELGDKTGYVIYRYADQIVGKIGITITDEYYNKIHNIEEPKEEKPVEEKEKSPVDILLIIVKVILWIIFIAVVFYLFLVCYALYKRKQRRKRRAEMRRRKREQEYRRYVKQMRDEE